MRRPGVRPLLSCVQSDDGRHKVAKLVPDGPPNFAPLRLAERAIFRHRATRAFGARLRLGSNPSLSLRTTRKTRSPEAAVIPQE
jgi:hypothetical protein